MGLTIYCDLTKSGGHISYTAFHAFRQHVADALDFRIGTAYRKICSHANTFNKDMLVSHIYKVGQWEHINKRAINFLFKSDSCGKLCPSACKVIADKLETYDLPDCEEFNNIKAAINDCKSKNAYLIWQ